MRDCQSFTESARCEHSLYYSHTQLCLLGRCYLGNSLSLSRYLSLALNITAVSLHLETLLLLFTRAGLLSLLVSESSSEWFRYFSENATRFLVLTLTVLETRKHSEKSFRQNTRNIMASDRPEQTEAEQEQENSEQDTEPEIENLKIQGKTFLIDNNQRVFLSVLPNRSHSITQFLSHFVRHSIISLPINIHFLKVGLISFGQQDITCVKVTGICQY